MFGTVMSHSDVEYAVAAFYRKRHAWPASIEELRTFVSESDGYLILTDPGNYSFRDMGDHVVVRLESRNHNLSFTVHTNQVLSSSVIRQTVLPILGVRPPVEASKPVEPVGTNRP